MDEIQELRIATFANREAVTRAMPVVLAAVQTCQQNGGGPVSFSMEPQDNGTFLFCATQGVADAFMSLVVGGEEEDGEDEDAEEEDDEACAYCHGTPCFWDSHN